MTDESSKRRVRTARRGEDGEDRLEGQGRIGCVGEMGDDLI